MNLLYPGRGAIAHDRLAFNAPAGGPIVQLENENIRCSVLPWFGAVIAELTHKGRGIDVLAPGDDAIHHVASQVFPMAPGLEYHNRRIGAWPELFPTGSSVKEYFGRPQPFHGESNQRRWDYAIIESGPGRAVARFTLHCTVAPLTLVREMTLEAGGDELTLNETVINRSDLEVPFMWGHHPTYGRSLLAEGAQIELPECRLIEGEHAWLTVPGPGAGVGHMFYAADLADGWFGVFNPQMGFGAGIRFDADLFKYLWLWQEFGNSLRAPGFGGLYNAAVEPFTSLPEGMDEHGDAGPSALVGPHETLSTELTAFFYTEPLKR